MLKKPEVTSNAERELLQSPSVYDFLYQDVRRVGSLLAQFDPSGLLQSIKHTHGFSESAQLDSKLKPALNLAAIKIEASVEETSSQGNSHSAERAYDPLWVNAVNLLSYLQDAGILKRDLDGARLGQIILVKGGLQVFDMATLQRLWSQPKILHDVLAQMGESMSTSKEELQKKSGILKLLSIMPHPVQTLLNTGSHKIWAVLNDASLEIAASSLFLKYGTKIDGEWNIVGVLDAFPDAVNENDIGDDLPDSESMLEVMAKLKHIARRIGRPASAYGMTPLLIFRQIVTST